MTDDQLLAKSSTEKPVTNSARPPFLQWITETLYQARSNVTEDEKRFAQSAMNKLHASGYSMDAMQNVEAAFLYYKASKDEGHTNAAKATLEFFKEQLN